MKKESPLPFTQIPNFILDHEGLSVYEFRLLVLIFRKTKGFGKDTDGISLSQFRKHTGISKDKIIKSLDSLQKKELILVKKQILENGGNTYNLYSPLVRHKDKGSTSQSQGLVRDTDTQKENNTNSREREDIFFNFYGEVENKKSFTKKFIDELISIENVRNPVSYRSTIEKKLNSKNKETLINFDKWYLNDYTEQLNRTYKSYFINDKEIMKIDNYFNFTSERKEMLGLVLKNKNNKAEVIYFDTKKEIEEYLKEAINETI